LLASSSSPTILTYPLRRTCPRPRSSCPTPIRDTGTLGGIATGLQQVAGWAIVVACDLPLVSAPLFARLAQLTAEQEGSEDRWDAVVPVVGGYEEPLHALYHRRCLPAIETRLAQGQRRVISFLGDVRTCYVSEEDLRAVDPAVCTPSSTPTRRRMGRCAPVLMSEPPIAIAQKDEPL
jgi:molybdopterin-guanine dinucleotide biosynthesis protein A